MQALVPYRFTSLIKYFVGHIKLCGVGGGYGYHHVQVHIYEWIVKSTYTCTIGACVFTYVT